MKRTMTYLFCYDDHRNFTEDIRKRFCDAARYKVSSFHTILEFLRDFRSELGNNSCKVAIIGVPEAPDQTEIITDLISEIKKIDGKTGIILLIPPDKTDEVRKKVFFDVDAYIPRNINAVLRIHNTVKKLFSEHSISFYRKRRNISVYVLLAFLVIALIVIIYAKLKLPGYF